jgi:hypothetical protein
MLLMLLMPVASMKAYAPANLTGAWTLEWKPDFSGHDATHECKLVQDRQKLTIECDGATMKGEVNGRRVTFQHQTGKNNEMTAVYKTDLNASGTTMTGTWHLSPENREGKFEARKNQSK